MCRDASTLKRGNSLLASALWRQEAEALRRQPTAAAPPAAAEEDEEGVPGAQETSFQRAIRDPSCQTAVRVLGHLGGGGVHYEVELDDGEIVYLLLEKVRFDLLEQYFASTRQRADADAASRRSRRRRRRRRRGSGSVCSD